MTPADLHGKDVLTAALLARIEQLLARVAELEEVVNEFAGFDFRRRDLICNG